MASFNENDCVERIVPGLCGAGRAGSQMSAGIRDFAGDRSRDLRGLTAKGRIPMSFRVWSLKELSWPRSAISTCSSSEWLGSQEGRCVEGELGP
jgi:hypothetical protein